MTCLPAVLLLMLLHAAALIAARPEVTASVPMRIMPDEGQARKPCDLQLASLLTF